MQKVEEFNADENLEQTLVSLMQDAVKIAQKINMKNQKENGECSQEQEKSAVNLVLKGDEQSKRFDFLLKLGNHEYSTELLKDQPQSDNKGTQPIRIYKKASQKKIGRQKLFTAEKKTAEKEKNSEDSDDSDSDNSVLELEEENNGMNPEMDLQRMGEEDFDFDNLALKIKQNTAQGQNQNHNDTLNGQELVKGLREEKKTKKKSSTKKKDKKPDSEKKIRRKQKKEEKQKMAAEEKKKQDLWNEIKNANLNSEELKLLKEQINGKIEEEYCEFRHGHANGAVKPGERHIVIKYWEASNAFEKDVDKDFKMDEPTWNGLLKDMDESVLKKRELKVEGKTYEEAIGKKVNSTFRYI